MSTFSASTFSEFSHLAVDVLNECYNIDEIKGQDLLVRELDHWGGATCVLIAVETDNKLFISQTACQTLLTSIWMGKISEENSLKKVRNWFNLCNRREKLQYKVKSKIL